MASLKDKGKSYTKKESEICVVLKFAKKSAKN